MKRARLPALLLLGGSLALAGACAELEKQTKKIQTDTSKASTHASETFQKPTKEVEEVHQGCVDRFDVKTVDFDEESSFGGAMAVNLAHSGLIVVDAVNPSTVKPEAKKKATEYKVKPTPKNEALRYLNTVGFNLGAQSERASVRYRFAVLSDDKVVNALSAPGGYVFLSRALLRKIESEDQLAGVLAHEIGHIVHRDALNGYSRVKVTACEAVSWVRKGTSGMKVPTGTMVPKELADSPLGKSIAKLMDSGSSALNLNSDENSDALAQITEKVVSSINDLGYAKEDEYKADEVAVDLLQSAGYSLAEYAKLLNSLQGGGALKNHPSGADRVAHIRKYIDQKLQSDPFFQPQPKDKAAIPLKDRLKPLLEG